MQIWVKDTLRDAAALISIVALTWVALAWSAIFSGVG